MNFPSEETLRLADLLQQRLAGGNLVPQLAKLYSQHTRLSARRPGLLSWGDSEASARLEEATKLLDAGLLQKDAGQENYRLSMRRAAEILEWLSHAELKLHAFPITLLAAAIYQLAGYPARSSGLLHGHQEEVGESPILRSFLSADFPSLMKHLVRFWSKAGSPTGWNREKGFEDGEDLADWLEKRIVEETASCLGIVCASMRWGQEPRLVAAIQKLKDIAGLMLQTEQPYSWLLAKLCSIVASEYVKSSLRSNLSGNVSSGMTVVGKTALERYFRLAYASKRAVAWPSQVAGFERLTSGDSFALCTPTGSGKTTIAEVAILQSLFSENKSSELDSGRVINAPLTLYMVPSRALAAEVESKLSRVLKQLTEEKVVVTGLYGGTDWGPTDAWLTSDDRTVLICTYEKAEALMRFLGPLFLDRVRLIVMDEAHTIQFDGNHENLRTSESRPLRLEALGMRLFSHVEGRSCRTIALSAVASGIDQSLSAWITGDIHSTPVVSDYRSTRQLIGRLEFTARQRFEIHYDFLDGASTRFIGGGSLDTPYILEPFSAPPPTPGWSDGPLKRIRPSLFWAAMNLAAPDKLGQQHGVLIAISERIGEFTNDFLELLEDKWIGVPIPKFFEEPPKSLDRRGAARRHLWDKCLNSCKDYYGESSAEFRLLVRGVIVHYGKMPGLMARLLVEVIEEKIVTLVMATSTLSEGVNLPFETILVTSLSRYNGGPMSVREFRNLIGRAGRPGVGTEGRSLVFIVDNPLKSGTDIRTQYNNLVKQLGGQDSNSMASLEATSPLAELINSIWEQWKTISQSTDRMDFYHWLEVTAPLSYGTDESNVVPYAVESLDSLDSVLLSALVEVEQLSRDPLSEIQIEQRLQSIWQRSYARFSSSRHEGLERVFLRRSHALLTSIYPNPSFRRQLYRTCLPPRSGNQLLKLFPSLRSIMLSGYEYAGWSAEKKLAYIARIVESVGSIAKFGYASKVGNKRVPIVDMLAWWLLPKNGDTAIPNRMIPNQKQVSSWIKYISGNLGYRFSWGIGSIIALAVEEAHVREHEATKLEDWPKTGLPWIVFWLKELITWGTLDPVVAFLLSSGRAYTRMDAEKLTAQYYDAVSDFFDENDKFDAITIRRWAEKRVDQPEIKSTTGPPGRIYVDLTRNFRGRNESSWRVIPVVRKDEVIIWTDPAGFSLATCPMPIHWNVAYRDLYDFLLDPAESFVTPARYLS